jgi:hypothetical protein
VVMNGRESLFAWRVLTRADAASEGSRAAWRAVGYRPAFSRRLSHCMSVSRAPHGPTCIARGL